MNKLTIAFIVSLCFVLPFANAAGAIWGDMDDSPSAVRGSVTVDGSPATSSIEVVASVSGEEYKSVSCDANGDYYVTVGGSSSDTIELAICGISAGSLSFSEGGVQELDLSASLQTDGTTGCTCDGICSGGNCVNPGSTGVCSSDTFFCDNDGICEADFGETTTTCSADCSTSSASSGSTSGSSGGGGGGGGGGGSSSSSSSSSGSGSSTGTATVDLPNTDTSGGRTVGSGSGNDQPNILDIFDEQQSRQLLNDGTTGSGEVTGLEATTQEDNAGGFLTGAVVAGQNVVNVAKENAWATGGILAAIALLVGGLIFVKARKAKAN